ncbi:DUF2953 domain-containing protein [Anaerocolumna xylanovorans]|uniref:DUF2953 domain-containing protein n=1 Tax=Anaerocolumna xylanovorans DSM 12503 TaxID=1121345 RepID=A0A1M7YCG5_9FIRM|nr:DUF2953 domain-containing protein [Anaerocolumna xylanovorans]SHO50342.1 Protein of unknown function [Anaerocolumna xylanovorans DSM 12503]
MIQIVLLILKIIGIILASVLGLLIALVLIVLFVPVRYKLKAEYEEDFKADARITWLLRIVTLTAEYGKGNIEISEISKEENDRDLNFRMRLRIFGRIIFDSSKKKEEKKEVRLSLFRGKKEKTKPGIKKKEKAADIIQPDIKHSQEVRTGEKAETTARTEIVRITKAASEAVSGVEDGAKAEVKVKELKKPTESTPVEEKNPDEPKKGIVHFLENISSGIKRLWDKFKAFFAGIKEKLKSIRLGFSEIHEKYNRIRLFFQNENNKLGLRYGFDSLKGILRHIRPRKIKAYIEFGTGDPCSTGQLLGVAAAFMGMYKNSVQVIPDFDEKVLKGNFYCRGRIRSVFLLIIGIKVIRNRNIRALINNFQTLKEEF